ncbi:MAG: cold shock domain-containing protein [Cryomorphaceae bacterium]|nr:MAG: cold shock domain-containing protein [Cryomorphaceae bacterium]
MPTGKVKFFDTAKCFGFIEWEGEELYVHAGDLIDLIKKNDRVSFEIHEENSKKSAYDVRKVKHG